MSIPASALKGDELVHNASLEPVAAAELARRIASGDIDPNAGLKDLREDIRMLESQADDSDEKLDRFRGEAEKACTFIKRAMNHDEDEERSVTKLLQNTLDCLECRLRCFFSIRLMVLAAGLSGHSPLAAA